jgi:F-type H+-transporting ATPase subunit delta
MANETVAKRYARALFEIARDERALERFEEELARVADAVAASRELREVLLNPVFDPEMRRRVLREVAGRLGTSPLVTNFVMILLDKRKLGVLPDIVRVFRALVDQAAGRVEAEVRSATPLDPGTTTRIQDELARWTGKQVRLTTTVDASLIGGAVARVGGLVLDGSIRTQLEELRERLASQDGNRS